MREKTDGCVYHRTSQETTNSVQKAPLVGEDVFMTPETPPREQNQHQQIIKATRKNILALLLIQYNSLQ